MGYFMAENAALIKEQGQGLVARHRLPIHTFWQGTSFILPYVVSNEGMTIYQNGTTYSLRERHRQPALCRVRLTAIQEGDIRHVSDGQLRALGYDTRVDFWRTWVEHGKTDRGIHRSKRGRRKLIVWDTFQEERIAEILLKREPEFHLCWWLSVEVVKGDA